MAVYRGVVKDNRVEVEGDTLLSDGARVEVRTGVDVGAPEGEDAASAEDALLRDLLAAGLLEEPPADEAGADEPFEPVTVRGRPLSEQIIEDRR